MTSPKTVISNLKSQISNPQDGVTLLLAILVLSAVLAISFSLATILLLEIKSSGDLTRSEASLYADTGIGEQAAFDLKRGVACTGGCTYITNFANNVALNGQPVVSATSTPIFQDQIKRYTTFLSNPKIYSFCAVGNNEGCNYGKLTISYLQTGNNDPLSVYLCQYNPSAIYQNMPPCSNPSDSEYWITGSNSDAQDNYGGTSTYGTLIYPGSNASSTTWTLNPNLQQELVLYNAGLTGSIYVSVETYGADGVTPVGLPYIGQTAVTVNTTNGDVGRSIQVLVPFSENTATSSGSSGPGPAATFSLTIPSAVSQGVQATGTITALDTNDNVATGYTGTVFLYTNAPSAVLPDNYFQLTNGTANFPFTINTTGGAFTIYAEDTVDGTINGQSNGVMVNPLTFNGYSYYRQLTIQASQITTSTGLSNFTVLACANGNASSPCGSVVGGLNLTSWGGHVQSTNGYDIIFTQDSGCTQLLNWDLENYNSTTGELEAWVKMPFSISNTSNSTFYMCYGNLNTTTFQGNNTQNGNTGSAWDSNYVGVWHFPGSSLFTSDSTGNNNGTAEGSATYAAGFIGSAANFNGSTQDIKLGTVGSGNPLMLNGSDVTVEMWLDPAATQPNGGSYARLIDKSTGGSAAGGYSAVLTGAASPYGLTWYSNGSGGTSINHTTTIPSGAWKSVAVTFKNTGDKATSYINGTATGASVATGGSIPNTSATMKIAAYPANGTRTYDGLMDELRISNIVRSSDWLATEYNNEEYPQNFISVGSEYP